MHISPPIIEPTSQLPLYESIIHMLYQAVQDVPEKTAYICEGQSITYQQFGRATLGFTNVLKSYKIHQKRVAILAPNSIATTLCITATMMAGGEAAPMNPFFTKVELMELFQKGEPDLVICHQAYVEKVEAICREKNIPILLAPTDETILNSDWLNDDSLTFQSIHFPKKEAAGLTLFTGGTTGVPKGVVHKHGAIAYAVLQHGYVWPADFEKEIFLTVTPMFHVYGLFYGLWMSLYAKGTLVIVPRYIPSKILEELASQKVTIFCGGPAPIYAGLLQEENIKKHRFEHLKHCMSGGSACPEALHKQWAAQTGVDILEGWGMTETAPLCNMPVGKPIKYLSVGPPALHTELQIVDLETGQKVLEIGETGEARVRGAQCSEGYLNAPEETALLIRDGWLYTGDIGYLDEDGYFFLIDRKKDVVMVGGFNVYPRQLDEQLLQHPKIAQVATLGVADDFYGEAIVAYVVVEKNCTFTEADFFQFCKENMVKYKRPIHVYFEQSLPKTGVGKIDKLALRNAEKKTNINFLKIKK